jgi:CRISPR-associated protein Csb3
MSFAVSVDPTNPGQFFACCGLLELADRLWPGAEGWFEHGRFHVRCEGSLADLIAKLCQARIDSSLLTDERKRLATYLSVSEKTLTPARLEEKIRLKEMWKYERLRVSAPFEVWVDWWRDHRGNRVDPKTWAAKQMVADMAEGMLSVVRARAAATPPDAENLFPFTDADTLPFNFDSDLSGQGAARDTGFSADTLGLQSQCRPLLELLALVGLQRVRPYPLPDDSFRFCLWATPLPLMIASAAGSGVLGLPGDQPYQFSLFSRTKYMKAFLPAKPMRGAHE